jgi:hypothetical protein
MINRKRETAVSPDVPVTLLRVIDRIAMQSFCGA